MLLEADVAAQNSQAELAQQMLGVSVRVLEVRPDVGVEGRPEVTHLQKNEPENSQVVFERQVVKMKKVFLADLADVRHLSGFVCGFHVPHEGRFTLKLQLTYFTQRYKKKTQFLIHTLILQCQKQQKNIFRYRDLLFIAEVML